jgi:Cd2+/Zn2+-exporting ATPase
MILKGEGVTANVDGEQVYIGNKRLFARLNMYDSIGSFENNADEWSNKGGTVGFIGIEGKGIVGAFCVTDSVRDEANQVVKDLLHGGIEVIMLTGDGDGAAMSVAKQVGLPESSVHSHLLPEDKLHFVASLIQPAPKRCGACKPKSLTMMVGDGINDAPALAVADVGVAMGEGAALAMEMSDITLMDCNLSKLVYTIKMGTRVVVTIQENIFLSLVAKLLVVGLTFAGKMTLLSAIAADVGIMLIVTLNGMKLLPPRSSSGMYGINKRRIDLRQSYNQVENGGFGSRWAEIV